jgi:hypothetical protein
MKQIKNKTEKVILWPKTTYFTNRDVFVLNKEFKEITIRVRITGENGEIAKGTVAEIGFIPGGKGRPQKVYALTPITNTVLNKAKADGVELVDNAEKKFINVVSVANSSSNNMVSMLNA